MCADATHILWSFEKHTQSLYICPKNNTIFFQTKTSMFQEFENFVVIVQAPKKLWTLFSNHIVPVINNNKILKYVLKISLTTQLINLF